MNKTLQEAMQTKTNVDVMSNNLFVNTASNIVIAVHTCTNVYSRFAFWKKDSDLYRPIDILHNVATQT